LTRHVRAIWDDKNEVDNGHENDEVNNSRNEGTKCDELVIDRPAKSWTFRGTTRERVNQWSDDVGGEGRDK
jgi:hypothetical protein